MLGSFEEHRIDEFEPLVELSGGELLANLPVQRVHQFLESSDGNLEALPLGGFVLNLP